MQDRLFPHLAALTRAFSFFEGPQDRALFQAAILSAPSPHPVATLAPPPTFFVVGGPGAGKTIFSKVMGLLYQDALPHRLRRNRRRGTPRRYGVDARGRTTCRAVLRLFQKGPYPAVAVEDRSMTHVSTLLAEILREGSARVAETGEGLGRYPHRPLIIVEMHSAPKGGVDAWGILIQLGEPALPVAGALDPQDYVEAHRAQLLADIGRAWRLWDEAGQPQAPGRWASHPFELWARDVGGVVTKILGEEGFLAG